MRRGGGRREGNQGDDPAVNGRSKTGGKKRKKKGLPHCATRVPTLQESGAEIYPPTLSGLEGICGTHVTGLENVGDSSAANRPNPALH